MIHHAHNAVRAGTAGDAPTMLAYTQHVLLRQLKLVQTELTSLSARVKSCERQLHPLRAHCTTAKFGDHLEFCPNSDSFCLCAHLQWQQRTLFLMA